MFYCLVSTNLGCLSLHFHCVKINIQVKYALWWHIDYLKTSYVFFECSCWLNIKLPLLQCWKTLCVHTCSYVKKHFHCLYHCFGTIAFIASKVAAPGFRHHGNLMHMPTIDTKYSFFFPLFSVSGIRLVKTWLLYNWT